MLVHEVRSLGLSLLPVVAWRLLLATALAVAVAALAAWLLAGRLTAPLGRLVTAARRVGDGDLSTRVQVDGDGEVAEVASAFNDMAAGLERAQTEQRAFLASVGHELKTPLTTVQGYTEALLDGTVDDPADRRRSLLRVHAETIRLARPGPNGSTGPAVGCPRRQRRRRRRRGPGGGRRRRRGRPPPGHRHHLPRQYPHAHLDPGWFARCRQLLDNAARSSPSGCQPWSRLPFPAAVEAPSSTRAPACRRGPPPRLTTVTRGPLPRHPRSGQASACHRQRSATPWASPSRPSPPRWRHRLPPHPPPVPHRPRRRPPAGRSHHPERAPHPPPPVSSPCGYEPPGGGFDSLSSRRCPSGSRKKQRTSHS